MANGHDGEPVGTGDLLNGLFASTELNNFIEERKQALHVPALHEYLCALCEEKGILRAEVIARAGLERSFGFQIFQGTKNPSRDKVLQLAIGFGLDYDQTQALLRIAQKSPLYPRIKRDAALIFCIHRHMGFTETQAMLSGSGITLLGKEKEA